jgi:hypothetical protein
MVMLAITVRHFGEALTHAEDGPAVPGASRRTVSGDLEQEGLEQEGSKATDLWAASSVSGSQSAQGTSGKRTVALRVNRGMIHILLPSRAF